MGSVRRGVCRILFVVAGVANSIMPPEPTRRVDVYPARQPIKTDVAALAIPGTGKEPYKCVMGQ